jgi:predicted metal-binding protein
LKYLSYTPRKIQLDIPESQIKEDLEKYRRMAIELGADDAKVIDVHEVILPFVDERVRFKCTLFPKCGMYNRNLVCPPRAPPVSEVREMIKKYRYGILMTLIAKPKSDFVGRRAPIEQKPFALTRKIAEITAKVESAAWYDGYVVAGGLVAGPCSQYLCEERPCTAIMPGGECRYPLRVRPAMEGLGINVFAVATKVGWDTYPVGLCADPDATPLARLVSCVLVC